MSSLADEILFGTKASVAKLIEEGADINAMDDYGYTPLIETVIAGHIDMAELLLEHGADVNSTDVTGRTALHWATDSNSLAFCDLFLAHKADPNAYSMASQPIFITPLLRDQKLIKKLFYQYKTDLNFAQDFINAKLLGHRFEVLGTVDIVDSKGKFIELDLEGFFLEFTVDSIRHSLKRYSNNFAARHLRAYFDRLNKIIDAFTIASELLNYQHFTLEYKDYETRIEELISNDLLLLPIAYHGHAISIIKYGNLIAKCDRGENSKRHGSVVIYQLNRPQQFNKNFIKFLMYEKLTKEFVDEEFYSILDMRVIARLPIASQLTGNCSWANIEASVPSMLFLLLLKEEKAKKLIDIKQVIDHAMHFYQQWLEWDKDRALDECIKSFPSASPARKASKASLLGAVLFQTCFYNVAKDIERAEKMLTVLTIPEYTYILKSYIQAYWKYSKTPAGENFINLLDICGVKL